jgi:predicted nucleic acid-binding protein
VTHLVDTSVWHTYQRSVATRTAIARLVDAGALLTTCPVVVAEYCFSARSAAELEELQEDMRLLYCLESESLKNGIQAIQTSLWATGFVRAAGSADTMIAVYALEYDQTVVTCDTDFLHIQHALANNKSGKQLRVLHIGVE